MRLVLYQPDIPQNLGALLRLGACLGVPVDVVEPCGFPLDERRIRRAGMDYVELAEMARHESWPVWREARAGRGVLLTTKARTAHTAFAFRADDNLILGRESAGVPEALHEAADARIAVPMDARARSLNVTQAAAIVLGEALRQLDAFPKGDAA